jgi:lysophospholipase L1-like esterase
MSRTQARIIIIGIGFLLIIMGAGSELFSSAAGFGPYQAMLIWLGILITLMGLIPAASWLSKLLMVLFSISMTLVLLEGMVWVWLKTTPPQESSFYADHIIEDEALIHRMRPFMLGHDANGWRNPTALGKADLIVLGDSQAWGYNSSATEAWPLLLGDLLGKSVYNMGFPGYGPADYYSLIPEALSHQPDIILIMLYFGNDFVNAANMVYSRPIYAAFRSPEFAVDEASDAVRTVIRVAELARTPAVEPPPPSALVQWLSTTATGKFLIYRGILKLEPSLIELYTLILPDAPEQQDFYTAGDTPLYFMPALREPAMNLQTPIVAEGMRLTQSFLSAANQQANEASVQIAIVLMPTAELVYAPLVESQHGELSTMYTSLVQAETETREQIIQLLEAENIPYFDLFVPLRQAALSGEYLFPSIDTHPTIEGNRLIAEYITENGKIIQP